MWSTIPCVSHHSLAVGHWGEPSLAVPWGWGRQGSLSPLCTHTHTDPAAHPWSVAHPTAQPVFNGTAELSLAQEAGEASSQGFAVGLATGMDN